jgi:hypothetical protein
VQLEEARINRTRLGDGHDPAVGPPKQPAIVRVQRFGGDVRRNLALARHFAGLAYFSSLPDLERDITGGRISPLVLVGPGIAVTAAIGRRWRPRDIGRNALRTGRNQS